MIAAVGTFLVAAIVIIVAASVLARAGGGIAESTGIGRVWIGAVLIAGATSLPELATDVFAVRMGAADIAAGDLFGSSMANMLILAVIDLLPPRRQVLRGAAFDNALAAGLAIVLNALAALFVLTHPAYGVWGIAPGSLLLVAVYLAGTRAIYRHGARQKASGVARIDTMSAPKSAAASSVSVPSLRRSIIQFALSASVILVSALFLAGAAKQIADLSGLGSTFVGTFLVGLATSLPELVACLAAVRMGSVDLAVGNLFGSNAFNMVVFFAMDLAAPTPIFAALDPSHALSALVGVVLMGLGLSAIVYRAEKRFALLEPDSAIMVLVYAVSIWLLYSHATGVH